ncbi:MAG: TrbI/VirB10 family protein [Gammaproteobacteria bacterium]|nr:TrbI/VirB10 family protein [Gammaproteobacteria bacterium]
MVYQSHIPKPPKGPGLSRRLGVLVGVLIVVVASIFLFFLHHYSPKSALMKKSPIEHSLVGEDEAMSVIRKIRRRPYHPPMTKIPQFIGSSKVHLSVQEFEQGSNSGLSVYHAPTRPMNHAVDSKRLSLDAASPQSLKVHASYIIKTGAIIPVTLLTEVNSDLPGTLIAKVREDVFDTKTGNFLLIPQGATLIGHYGSHINHNQSRLFLVWNKLIFPNGESLSLNALPGIDLTGKSGLYDQVNHHYFRTFGSAFLLSVLDATAQLNQPQTTNNQLSIAQVFTRAASQQLTQTGAAVIQKNLNSQPTITIRPGINFNVLVNRDVVFKKSYVF